MGQRYGLHSASVGDTYPLTWVGVGDFWYIQNLVTGKFASDERSGLLRFGKTDYALIHAAKVFESLFLWVPEEQAFPGRFREPVQKPPTNFGGWHAEVLAQLEEAERQGANIVNLTVTFR